jgi:hypothetical protein
MGKYVVEKTHGPSSSNVLETVFTGGLITPKGSTEVSTETGDRYSVPGTSATEVGRNISTGNMKKLDN